MSRSASARPFRPTRLPAPLARGLRFGALGLLGIWIGAMASVHTSSTLKPVGPAPIPAAPIEGAPDPARDAEAARRWARHAFDVGLRDCPRVTEAFHRACTAQMATEQELADAAARARAEFAAEFAYQPVYLPEAEPMPDYDALYGAGYRPALPAPESRAIESPGPESPGLRRRHPDMDGDPATRAERTVPVIVDIAPPAVAVRPPPAG